MIDIKRVKTVKSLTIANAILLIFAIVPVLGIAVVDYGGIIPIVVLAILILVKQKSLGLNPAPNYFVFAGALLSFITIMMIVIMFISIFQQRGSQLPPSSLLIETNMLAGTILFYVLGFFAWCFYLVAMIMYWVNLSQLNQMIYKYEYEMLMNYQKQNLSNIRK